MKIFLVLFNVKHTNAIINVGPALEEFFRRTENGISQWPRYARVNVMALGESMTPMEYVTI